MNKFLSLAKKGSCLLALFLASISSLAQHTFPAEDTNNVMTGTNTYTKGATLGPVTYATLPSELAGTLIWCTDCQANEPVNVCAGGGGGAWATGANSQWYCTVSFGSFSNLVYFNSNNAFAAGVTQTFNADPLSNVAPIVIGLQSGVSPAAPIGSLFGLFSALSANGPRLGWWDGQFLDVLVTNNDSACDLLYQCTGDPLYPVATQKSPQLITPSIDNATAISISFPNNPSGDLFDLQQGIATPFCQYIATSAHIYMCYGSDGRLQISNNGHSFADVVTIGGDISGVGDAATVTQTNGTAFANSATIDAGLFPIINICGGLPGATNGGIYIFFPASKSPSTCTSSATTGSSREIPVLVGATASKLSVLVGTACSSASTAVKLYHNGTQSSLAVLIGTTAAGTVVTDTTHTVSFTAGDTYSVRVITGQASETCSDFTATFYLRP